MGRQRVPTEPGSLTLGSRAIQAHADRIEDAIFSGCCPCHDLMAAAVVFMRVLAGRDGSQLGPEQLARFRGVLDEIVALLQRREVDAAATFFLAGMLLHTAAQTLAPYPQSCCEAEGVH